MSFLLLRCTGWPSGWHLLWWAYLLWTGEFSYTLARLLNADCLKVGVAVHFGKLHFRSFELLKPVVLQNVRQLDWPDWIRHIIGSLLQHITRQIQTQGLEQASFPVFCSSSNWQEIFSINLVGFTMHFTFSQKFLFGLLITASGRNKTRQTDKTDGVSCLAK